MNVNVLMFAGPTAVPGSSVLFNKKHFNRIDRNSLKEHPLDCCAVHLAADRGPCAPIVCEVYCTAGGNLK